MTQPTTSDAGAVPGNGADHGTNSSLPRAYPSMQPTQTPPNVDLSTDFTDHLAAGGYPDVEEAGLAYAAGQRAAARQQESRTALTTGAADSTMMYPGNSQHPGQPRIANPVPDDNG